MHQAAGVSDPSDPSDPNVEYRAWLDGLAARRRFGPADRLGTANLIDGAARTRAARAVVDGTALPLARPLVDQHTVRDDGRPGFRVEVFYTDGPIGMGSEHVEIDCHGTVNTHLDALNHIGVGGTWYGGFAVDDPASHSVVDLARHGLVTRGVVVDVPGVRGEPWVAPDRPVTAGDVEAALGASGTAFEPGDALLLYMGRDRYEAAGHDMAPSRGDTVNPGVGRSAAEWVVEHDVSILCWDFLDSNHPGEPLACVHLLNWAVGLVLVDNCDLGPAAAAARAGRATGTLAVSPIAVPGGTGSLVQPVLVI
jgi:kynurenine formamidase